MQLAAILEAILKNGGHLEYLRGYRTFLKEKTMKSNCAKFHACVTE